MLVVSDESPRPASPGPSRIVSTPVLGSTIHGADTSGGMRVTTQLGGTWSEIVSGRTMS